MAVVAGSARAYRGLASQLASRTRRSVFVLDYPLAPEATVPAPPIAVMAAYGGIHRATMPQTQVETIDPTTLHLNGEFIESNLGSAIEPNGSVTVRVIGQQYSFTPQCILVPTDTPIIMRATSPDVVHGFLIEGTNVNTMLVPGYISDLPVQFNKP